jgi:hypothetical protein
MSDYKWLWSNKEFIKKLNGIQHKFLWWGVFVVVTVFFVYLYINGLRQQVGQSSPYYDAVLIFIGGFFGSAYWEGFKWAVTCEDEPKKPIENIERPEITTSSEYELVSNAQKPKEKPIIPIERMVAFLTQIVAITAILTILLQVISFIGDTNLKIDIGFVCIFLLIVFIIIFRHDAVGVWIWQEK